MRRALASLLIAVISLPLIMTVFVFVHFHLDRERIIKEVCVERFKPVEENCCKGSCHLEKQLKEPEGQEQGPKAPPRFEVRVEPAIIVGQHSCDLFLLATDRVFAIDRRAVVSVGYPAIDEPVPLS